MRAFSLYTLTFNVLVILWGAFVRASGSGAGCGAHWPLCNGVITPSTDNIQTLIELSHRLTSGIAFILVTILYFGIRKKFDKKSLTRKSAYYSLIFMVIEALIGACLVLLKLVADNSSSYRAIVVGLHLVNSFALLAALTFTYYSQIKKLREFDKELLKAKILFITVAMFGAITALGDTLFPSESLTQGIIEDLSFSAHFLIKLRIWHPVLAIITSIYIYIYCNKKNLEKEESIYSILQYLIIFQIIFGFVNLLLLAPIWAQIIHLFFACACWVCLTMCSFSNTERLAKTIN